MPGSFLGNTQGVFIATVPLTPLSVAAATTAEQTFPVFGLRVGDFVCVTGATQNGIGIGQARVGTNDALSIRFINTTAGALTPTAGPYTVLVTRPEGGARQTVVI